MEGLGKDGTIKENGSYIHAMCGLNPSGSEEGPIADSYELDNKPLASMKCEKYLNYTSNYMLLKRLYAPCS